MPVTRGVGFMTFNGYNLSFEYLAGIVYKGPMAASMAPFFTYLGCFFFVRVCVYVY